MNCGVDQNEQIKVLGQMIINLSKLPQSGGRYSRAYQMGGGKDLLVGLLKLFDRHNRIACEPNTEKQEEEFKKELINKKNLPIYNNYVKELKTPTGISVDAYNVFKLIAQSVPETVKYLEPVNTELNNLLHREKIEALKDLNENELKTKISTDLEKGTIDNFFQITKNIFQAFQKSNLISLEISQGVSTYLSFFKDSVGNTYLPIVENNMRYYRIYEGGLNDNKDVIIEKINKILTLKNIDLQIKMYTNTFLNRKIPKYLMKNFGFEQVKRTENKIIKEYFDAINLEKGKLELTISDKIDEIKQKIENFERMEQLKQEQVGSGLTQYHKTAERFTYKGRPRIVWKNQNKNSASFIMIKSKPVNIKSLNKK